MNAKINVLDIEIDNCTAKEAMKKAVEYLASEPVNTIDLLTVDALMRQEEAAERRKIFDQLDLVLAGDGMILEAAGIESRKYLQETENQVFLRMFLRYLHKNHRRIYLLVESEEDGQELYDYLERAYGGIEIVGMAKVSAQKPCGRHAGQRHQRRRSRLCVIGPCTAIAGRIYHREPDAYQCRTLDGPWRRDAPGQEQGIWKGRFSQFLVKMIFKKEIEKWHVKKRGN